MNEEQQKQVAIFRFGVISDFVTPTRLERGEQERLLAEKCARQWPIPFSQRTRIARGTILAWIRQYEKGGRRLEALYPQQRNDRGSCRALDEDTAQAIVRLRRELPLSPVRTLVAEMRRRRMIPPGVFLSLSTVYRLLQHHGLMDRPQDAPEDRRRFEAELPNDLWQSDAMHGPMVSVEGRQKKCYLLAFLDDMSRLVPHAEFYAGETLDRYLDALRQALLKRGLPRKLYVDNGPAFRSRHLEEICASLGIALRHSRPYRPEGRGKCERWFRTVRTEFLPGFRGQTLEDLNLALDLWIREIYHQRTHSSTGMSPLQRFAQHMECLRPAPKDLEDYFRKRARRRVARDRTVALGGRLYEAPVPLIGKQVTLMYHEHDPARVEVLLENRSHGLLRPVNLQVNSRVRRTRGHDLLESTPNPLTGGRLPFGSQKKDNR
jgi:transposase InsO family protein